jgi:hypothetical protein
VTTDQFNTVDIFIKVDLRLTVAQWRLKFNSSESQKSKFQILFYDLHSKESIVSRRIRTSIDKKNEFERKKKKFVGLKKIRTFKC